MDIFYSSVLCCLVFLVMGCLADESPNYQPDYYDYDYDNMELPEPQPLVPDITTISINAVELKKLHEEVRLNRLLQIKEAILEKLGYDSPPNVSRDGLHRYPSRLVPNLDRNIEKQLQNDEATSENEPRAKISQIVNFASTPPPDKLADTTANTIYFNTPDSVTPRNLVKAIFMVYIKYPGLSRNQTAVITLTPNHRSSKPISSRVVHLNPRGHWEHFDITQLYQEWVADGEANVGLDVKATYAGENIVQYGNADENNDTSIHKQKSRTPLMKLTLDSEATRVRSRRSLRDTPMVCDPSDNEERCCRYNFVVSFDEIGAEFDFIVTPRRYLANYCMGMCPSYYLPTNGNSHLLLGSQASRHKIQRCCTASRMSPLEIVYMNEDNAMVQGTLPGMTIDSCTCS